MDGWVDFDITVTKFISAIRMEHENTWVYETRNRRSWGLVLFYKGVVDYKDKNLSFRIFPNTVVWLPMESTYSLTSVGQEEVSFAGLSFLLEEDTVPFKSIRLPVGNKDIAFLFDEALKIATEKDFGYNLALKIKILQILQTLLRLNNGDARIQTTGYCQLNKSVDYIHSHLDEKISIQALSQISGYSLSYYRRLFNAEFGMSPIYYINLKRVEKAQKLLLGGMHTKSEIAQACGFENQQFFAKIFKKYTGKTPSEFCKTF